MAKYRLVLKETSKSVKNYKAIANKIKKEVNNHLDDLVGNQNCMLCTWCFEAQLRGLDILPRPVHSPKDVIFSLKESIVKNPVKLKFSSVEELENLITEEGSRYYIHISWKGQGGHEFVLSKIEGKVYAIDSQEGIVEPLKEYLKEENEIDFKNSYIFRLDNKQLNYNLLKYNNMKYYKPLTKEDLNELK